MSNTVTLKADKVYTLTAGTREFPGMRQVSAWENFMKLQDSAGNVAILYDGRGPLSKSLEEAFDNVFSTGLPAHQVVVASKAIRDALDAQGAAACSSAQT